MKTTTLALLALFAVACNDQAYCFLGCDDGGGGQGAGGGSGGSNIGGEGAGFTTTGFGGEGGEDCGDTSSSLENCGACGTPCALAGATPVCADGQCLIQACLDGQYDIDGVDQNGCEYVCAVPNPSPELCDGIDNDCDALVDAADPDLVAPLALCNTTPGTPCEDTAIVCNGSTGWSCEYPPEVETIEGFIRETETLCDDLDGNCDGSIDEWFTDLGDACEDAGLGVCKDFGIRVCDAASPHQTRCDLSVAPDPDAPGPEQCDALDNDCNGFVDDALPATAFDMTTVPGGSGVKVDRFEASRPDATLSAPGIGEQVACSKGSVLPWTGGGYEEARAACEARGPGFRLCTLAELEDACRGAADTDYPYGNAYDGMACNGVDRNEGEAVPTGSIGSCADAGATGFDLSGNVAEWTATQTNAPLAAPGRIFALSGGSYLSPELGLACSIDLAPRALETTLLPNIGFRCCKDP
ncbi:MAG: SUMF1/EgtB/PvdO family nonheme iron enzyme [Polyangiaceae bacterium]|nr:SUMF1/EgtB/PvdO family nonheme iron enzyme [Polyangiaceae bacterium]